MKYIKEKKRLNSFVMILAPDLCDQ